MKARQSLTQVKEPAARRCAGSTGAVPGLPAVYSVLYYCKQYRDGVDMKRKRKPGPKLKPARKRKDRVVAIRVNEVEYRKFERLANAQHITVGAWVRAEVLKGMGKRTGLADLERRQQEQEELLAEMKALLNQTVRLYQSAAIKDSKESE